MDAKVIGETTVAMGAGRERKEDSIDHAVGIVVHHKVGDALKRGDALFTLHASSPESLARAREQALTAVEFSDTPVEPLPLFYEVIQ
jgi:pyrimidine-nucleoside phosphorylase